MKNKKAFTPKEAVCFMFGIPSDPKFDAESNNSDASIRCFGIARTNRN